MRAWQSDLWVFLIPKLRWPQVAEAHSRPIRRFAVCPDLYWGGRNTRPRDPAVSMGVLGINVSLTPLHEDLKLRLILQLIFQSLLPHLLVLRFKVDDPRAD